MESIKKLDAALDKINSTPYYNWWSDLDSQERFLVKDWVVARLKEGFYLNDVAQSLNEVFDCGRLNAIRFIDTIVDENEVNNNG